MQNNIFKIKFTLLIIFLIFLVSNPLIPKKKSKKDSDIPDLIQELIMPSGFDNDFIKTILNKEQVVYYKPTIRIANFEMSNTFLDAIDNHEYNIKEELKSKLFETGRYELLVSDENLDEVFKEQNKAGMDDYSDETDVEFGELKVASYTLTGKISHSYPIVKQVGGYFSLKVSVGASLTVINTTTGEIAYTKNIKSENEEKLFVTAEGMIIQGPRNLTNKPINSINATGSDIDLSPQYYKALENAISQITYLIEEKHPIMGEVLSIKKDQIVTTANEQQGIKKGDYLFIVRIEDPIQDSAGNILGYSKTLIGASLVLSVEKNMSTSKIIKLKDKKIKPEKFDFVISLPTIKK